MKSFIYTLLFFFLGAGIFLGGCTTKGVKKGLSGDSEAHSIGTNDEGEPTEDVATDSEDETSNSIAEPLPKKKWREVTTLDNKKNKKPKKFKIKGKQWKVRWELDESASSDDEFIVIMHNAKNPDDSEIIANQLGGQSDFIELDRPEGEYYLDVNTNAKYKIVVEEYK